MRDITVRVAGTCCFVDGSGQLSVPKRLVLPHDTLPNDDPTKRHIGYVEFPDDHITRGREFLSNIYQHHGYAEQRISSGQINYRRFTLLGHRITIENVASGDLDVKDSFTQHVPSMTVVDTDLYAMPREECFRATPPVNLLCGFWDIPSGTLLAGPLYEFITVYESAAKGVTLRIQTPHYVDVVVPISTQSLTVTIGGRQIVLDEDADLITIGNQPEDDITGTGSGDDITHHFQLYYNLAIPGNVEPNPPLPRKVHDPVNSCTPTGWP